MEFNLTQLIDFTLSFIFASAIFLFLFAFIFREKINLISGNPLSFIFNFLKGSITEGREKRLYESACYSFQLENNVRAKELIKLKLSRELDFEDISSIVLLVKIMVEENKIPDALKLILKTKDFAPEEFDRLNGSKQLDKLIGSLYEKLNNLEEATKYYKIYENYNHNLMRELKAELELLG